MPRNRRAGKVRTVALAADGYPRFVQIEELGYGPRRPDNPVGFESMDHMRQVWRAIRDEMLPQPLPGNSGTFGGKTWRDSWAQQAFSKSKEV